MFMLHTPIAFVASCKQTSAEHDRVRLMNILLSGAILEVSLMGVNPLNVTHLSDKSFSEVSSNNFFLFLYKTSPKSSC